VGSARAMLLASESSLFEVPLRLFRSHRLGVIALLERRPMSVPLIKLIVLASFCRMHNSK
jgi:hypothetical protein